MVLKEFLKLHLSKQLKFLCGSKNDIIDRTAFWNMVMAILTLILFFIAGTELIEIRTTRNVEFIRDFSKDFFSPECRELIMLCENNCIEFEERIPGIDKSEGKDSIEMSLNNFGYFTVKVVEYPRIKAVLHDSTKLIYTGYEIDDILLNKLDDIAIFESKNIIEIEDVSRIFGFYFKTICENKEIKNYMAWSKEEYEGKDYFENLLQLYDRIKVFELQGTTK